MVKEKADLSGAISATIFVNDEVMLSGTLSIFRTLQDSSGHNINTTEPNEGRRETAIAYYRMFYGHLRLF